MTWQITWSLILGFALSAVIQAVVRRETIGRLLGDDRPRTLAIATGLGASSSSCSYAAVALARSLFRKGASFTSAMVFEIASDQPGDRAGRHPGPAARLAVHPGRVRRRPDHDRVAGGRLPDLRPRAPDRRGARAGRQGTGRVDGGPRCDGHVHPVRGRLLGPAREQGRLHRGQPHLRDGVGGGAARHRHRPADRRRRRGVGARVLLAARCSSPITHSRARSGGPSSGRSSRC